MTLAAGRNLSHYRILRQVGAGGMGEVYEAEDLKLGRRVALKVMPEETTRDPQRRERFEREARAVAALNHPNIVTLYSVEEAEGLLFITLELLEGRTLRDALPRGGLALGQLLDISIPLSEALAAAHQQGITHRDLKPENVLITRDGKLKVLDFGLAKVEAEAFQAAGASVLPTRALTEEGKIVGTVAYMSPEQAEGKRVDARSDVFTLGIILYELSTGERPFKGDTTVSLLSSILKDHPKPLSEINTLLPRDLARIVDRCMMKDPARRFQSAMGLATELQTLKQDSDSGEIALPSRSSVTAGRAAVAAAGGNRTRILSLSAAAAAVAILAGTALWMTRSRPGSTPAPGSAGGESGRAAAAPPATTEGGRRKIVVLPFENLGTPDDAYFAAGMTEEITSRLAAIGGLGVISRTSAVQYAKTGKTTKQIGAELGVDYVLEGTVRWERGPAKTSRVRVTPQLVRVSDETQLWGDRYDREMKDIFDVQSEIAEQVVGKLGLAMETGGREANAAPPTRNLDAYQAYLKGKADSNSSVLDASLYKHAVRSLEEAVRLDPEFAMAWAELSRAYTVGYHFRFVFNEEQLAKARGSADRALALDPGLREGHLALGYYYYQGRRDYASAVEEFRRVAGDRADDPDALEAMGYVLRRQGRWDESLAALEKAYALNPRNANLVSNLAGTYEGLRRYTEALRYHDVHYSLDPSPYGALAKVFCLLQADGSTTRAREVLKSIDRREFPELPGIESLLEETDRHYEKALALLDEYPHAALDTQNTYLPKTLIAGLTYFKMKDRTRAAERCEAARKALANEIAANPRDARRRAAMGQALACLGRKDEALREARLAADIVPMSVDAMDAPVFLQNLATVQVMVGDLDAATDLFERLFAMPGGTHPNQIRMDPLFAPLLEYPRFKPILAKYP